jgi:hypothetical protein
MYANYCDNDISVNASYSSVVAYVNLGSTQV